MILLLYDVSYSSDYDETGSSKSKITFGMTNKSARVVYRRAKRISKSVQISQLQ